MSARLLSLAFDAQTFSHVSKLVLQKLVDCCDDNGRNIYPSVARLARAAMASERQVQRILRTFCEVGLLTCVREGGRGARNTSCYELSLPLLKRLGEEGWEAVFAGGSHAKNAMVSAGSGDSHDEIRVTPCHPYEDARVTSETIKGDIICHPTPQENPSNLRERAREDGEGRADETAGQLVTLDDFRAVWPSAHLDDQSRLTGEWARLTLSERRAALAAAPGWLAEWRALGRTKTPASWRFLADRAWTLKPAGAAEPAATGGAEVRAAPGMVHAPGWSKIWWAELFARIGAGRSVDLMIQRAEHNNAGMTLKQAEAPGEAVLATFRAFSSQGPEIERWRPWLAARGARLPVFRTQFWIYLPSPFPPVQGVSHDQNTDSAKAG